MYLGFLTAKPSPHHRRLARCLPGTGRTPAALVSTMEIGVTVVAMPEEVMPWSPPHLCQRTDAESSAEARDGQKVAVASLILGHPDGLVDVDVSARGTVDGGAPLVEGLTVPGMPRELSPRM